MQARLDDLQKERDYWRLQAESLSAELERVLAAVSRTAENQQLKPTTIEPRQLAESPASAARPGEPNQLQVVPATGVPGAGRVVDSSQTLFVAWLGNMSIATLRISLGLVFLGFGLLKFFPDVSSAEDISQRTVDKLTFGRVSGNTARILVATIEVTIGICLVSGKFLRLGLALLAIAGIGILAPLVLFTDELFARKYNAPTLLGQYVIKDIVLLAAGLVVVAQVIAETVLASDKNGQ